MESRILVDTNVLLDYFLGREPFYEEAEKIVRVCVDGQTKGCIAALQNENFPDFEDCLQMEWAKAYQAQYIVTRNVADYKISDIPAVTPIEYLEILNL